MTETGADTVGPARALGVYTRRAAGGFQIETYHDAYTLNESAGYLWTRVGRGEPEAVIAGRLADRYRIPAEQARTVVESFLRELVLLGFVDPARRTDMVDVPGPRRVLAGDVPPADITDPDPRVREVAGSVAETAGAEVVLLHRASPVSVDSRIVSVLTAGPPQVAEYDSYLDSHSGKMLVTTIDRSGLEVQVHRLAAGQIDELLAIFDSGVPTQESGGLSRADRALFRRLASAVPVVGGAQFEQYRNRLRSGCYDLWLAETQKYSAENFLEDVAGLLEIGDHESAAMCVRDAFVSAVESALALHGDLSDVWEDFERRIAAATDFPLSWAEVSSVLFMHEFTRDPRGWVRRSARAAEKLLFLVEDRWFPPS